MGFPKIKDRLFSQSKNRVFFYSQDHTKWTDSRSLLFVLPQKAQQRSAALALMHVRAHVWIPVENTRLVYVLEIVETKGERFDV